MQSSTKLLCFQSIQLSHQGDSAPYQPSLILCLLAPCNPTASLHLLCAWSNLNVWDAQTLFYLYQETHTGTFSVADTAERKKVSTPSRTTVNVSLAFQELSLEHVTKRVFALFFFYFVHSCLDSSQNPFSWTQMFVAILVQWN